ncbi:MAG: sugar phosphate isomerase/epimerase family protein [Candidatus Acidiferrales bacterium]|jgi:L-ribulose-5-phosphate 3-epimerase
MPSSDQRILAASPFCFGGFDPWVAYRYLKKAGVRYVEVPAVSQSVSLRHGLTTFAPEAMDAEDVSAMRNRLAEMGLQPVSVDAVCKVLAPRDVEALRRRIDFARDLGCTFVITDSCDESEFAQHRAKVFSNLGALASYAADQGIRIALETHGGPTRNGKLAKEFLEELAHPNVGCNYDTGNIFYYNDNVDPAEDIREIADKVVHVHLKDTQGGKEEWKFCGLGEGRVNFAKIIATLDSVGFRGPYSIEIEGIEGEDLNREDCLQRLVRSIEHLKKLGLTIS